MKIISSLSSINSESFKRFGESQFNGGMFPMVIHRVFCTSFLCMHGLYRVGFYFVGEFIENLEQIHILEVEFLYGPSLHVLATVERLYRLNENVSSFESVQS